MKFGSGEKQKLAWLSSMKFPHQSGAYNEGAWDPGTLLWAITFPIHQVLEPLPPVVHIQESSYCDRMTMHKSGWVEGDWPEGTKHCP